MTGRLSQFLNEQKNALALQGAIFIRAPGSSTAVGSSFLRFINETYRIQQAVYPDNSLNPRFEYTVNAHLPEVGGFKSEKLSLDGQELTVTAGSGAGQKFIWPGMTTHSATLSLNNGGGDLDLQNAQGLWAVAHFLGGYRWQPNPNGYSIQGPLLGPTGQAMTSGGHAVEVRLDIDFKGVPLFEAGFLSSIPCPSRMAQ